jgi:serine protease Do
MKRSGAALAGLLVLAACERPIGSPPPGDTAPPAAANAPALAPASFPEVYERVSPAVVSIYAMAVATPPAVIYDTPFGRVLERRPQVRSMSSGSGFFISAEGHIVTNDHVLGEAQEVVVVTTDERKLRARVVGRDPATDLAVVKVDGADFPFVSFSRAANPRVGEAVIAIGNPFGLGTTATSGIVSAYGRNIGSAYVDFVQLDAAINQGNSGGPTFNAQGEVVGVNSAIFSPTGANVGIGFAIPAALARQVTDQLIRTGRVERGFIGAGVGDLNPAQAEALGAPQGGAVIASLAAGGPAADAGLRPGDVIVQVDGEAVSEAADVIRRVSSSAPGARLRMRVLRQGRAFDVTVAPERRSSAARVR